MALVADNYRDRMFGPVLLKDGQRGKTPVSQERARSRKRCFNSSLRQNFSFVLQTALIYRSTPSPGHMATALPTHTYPVLGEIGDQKPPRMRSVETLHPSYRRIGTTLCFGLRDVKSFIQTNCDAGGANAERD